MTTVFFSQNYSMSCFGRSLLWNLTLTVFTFFLQFGPMCHLREESYVRGVGVIPSACPSSHPNEHDGDCYRPCRSGYVWVRLFYCRWRTSWKFSSSGCPLFQANVNFFFQIFERRALTSGRTSWGSHRICRSGMCRSILQLENFYSITKFTCLENFWPLLWLKDTFQKTPYLPNQKRQRSVQPLKKPPVAKSLLDIKNLISKEVYSQESFLTLVDARHWGSPNGETFVSTTVSLLFLHG